MLLNLRIDDLLPIVNNNPLVPPEREYLYAQGLHAGFEGDYVIAAHLLISQFENSVRYILVQRGVRTSGLDSKGVQEEYDLNTTLRFPESKEIFGEDILFDLQGLLIERFGVNLRNRLAHGLLSHSDFYSTSMVYLWWLLLRLCCWPIIIQQARSEARQPAPENSSEGSSKSQQGANAEEQSEGNKEPT